MVAYRLLISFDHYYSQLASDGAVVLCKLGLYAAMVLVVSTSAFQAERASSNLVGCSKKENQLFRLDRGLAVHWQTTGITPVKDTEPNRKGNKVQAE